MRRLSLLCLISIAMVANAATVTINVGPGTIFNPNNITVNPGDTVKWVWQAGAGAHTSQSDSPVAVESWNSGVLVDGQSFSHTFSTAGNWPFYCSLHSVPGGVAMNGVVHVNAPAPVAPTLSRTMLMLLAAMMVVSAFAVLRR